MSVKQATVIVLLLIWYTITYMYTCFPDAATGKESTYQCRRPKRLGFDPWIWKNPWSRKWQPTPVFLPGESHGQRSMVGYCPWDQKESTEWAHTHTHTHTHTFIYIHIIFIQSCIVICLYKIGFYNRLTGFSFQWELRRFAKKDFLYNAKQIYLHAQQWVLLLSSC